MSDNSYFDSLMENAEQQMRQAEQEAQFRRSMMLHEMNQFFEDLTTEQIKFLMDFMYAPDAVRFQGIGWMGKILWDREHPKDEPLP